MLALPTQSRLCGKRLFQERCSINEDLDFVFAGMGKPLPKTFELALEKFVIVAIECIDRYHRRRFVLQPHQRFQVRRIGKGKDHSRPCLRPDHLRRLPAALRFREPVHVAMTASFDKLRETLADFRGKPCCRDPVFTRCQELTAASMQRTVTHLK